MFSRIRPYGSNSKLTVMVVAVSIGSPLSSEGW